MTDHCLGHLCVVSSEEGCAAGEPDHRQCQHWQMGALREQCQKSREILLAMLVRRLAARLKKIAPDDGLADRAMGCLQRLGFSSPWRDAAPDLADTCSG